MRSQRCHELSVCPVREGEFLCGAAFPSRCDFGCYRFRPVRSRCSCRGEWKEPSDRQEIDHSPVYAMGADFLEILQRYVDGRILSRERCTATIGNCRPCLDIPHDLLDSLVVHTTLAAVQCNAVHGDGMHSIAVRALVIRCN